MIATPEKTHALLKKYRLYPKRKWGQNFLINQKTAKQIVELAPLSSQTTVLEIGPGLGALSELIIPMVSRYIGIEIDPQLAHVLQQEFQHYPHVQIIEADFLKFDFPALLQDLNIQELVVISNLPYYITSSILIKLITTPAPYVTLITMVQKEVAIRVVENKGGKDFNELSLIAQLFTKAQLPLQVSKDDFYPKPDVDSAIVTFHDITFNSNDASFVTLIRALFTQRRKTIYNNLLAIPLSKEVIIKTLALLTIPPSTRAESLEISTLQLLYQHLKPYL